LPEPVVIEPHSISAISVIADKSAAPKGTDAIAVTFAGTTGGGDPVRVEACADVSFDDRRSKGLKIGRMAVTHLQDFRAALETLLGRNGPRPEEVQPVELAAKDGFLEAVRLATGGLKLGRVGQFALSEQTKLSWRAVQTRQLPAKRNQVSEEVIRGLDVLQAPIAQTFAAIANARTGDANLPASDGLASVQQLADANLVDLDYFATLKLDAPPEDGKECDSDNLPDDLGDWVCQATAERREVNFPGRFMNARKGDVILSPGGMGPIGGLLRQVMPPQRYSHSGMMTRNYDTITHSTASEDRLRAYPVGSILGDPYPTEGHRPDVVKYAWPGVVTQPVEQAIHGGDMVDPESHATYSISSFSARNEFMEVGGVWEIVPPLVLKPDPMKETPDLRKLLHRVADDAAAQAGKSHYRFYCYTDPTIGESTVAPAEAGWAAGTFPTVCSSFIWLMMKRAGVHLESTSDTVAQTDLEPGDVAAGAQRNDATRDGLYLYTAGERLSAGEYLFNYLHETVRKTEGDEGVLGELAEAFSDMADDVANQMVNAFASDWCDPEAKDSDKWHGIESANAVSPDNLLLWDGVEKGGPYGFAAPVIYREPRREVITVNRWKLVPTRGALSGTVRYNGAAVAGAMVQLYDGMTAFTDATGNYRLQSVPFGRYEVRAAKDGGHVYLTATAPIELGAAEMTLDIDLHGPSEDFRVVKVSGNIHMLDYEDVGKDEPGDQPMYAELFVGPFGTHGEHTFVGKCGSEVRVEFRVVVDWQIDRSVAIYYEHKFFEGTSEDTNDLDGVTSKSFSLGAGYFAGWNSNIRSGGAGESHVSVTFENAVNPN
jgi:hypothetical protein